MKRQITYALRIFAKYRLYTGISIIGLAIAISSFWFIANFVNKSHQYDAFHQNHDKIYRLTMEVSTAGSTDHYAATGKPAGNVLANNYSGIEAYANMTFHRDAIVKVENDLFSETGFFSINPETFDVFTFDFISGNKTTFSSDPNAVLLSKSLALKYFNSTDIVGEQITICKANHTVKGVFEDWPENSHLDVKALLNSEVASHTSGYQPQDWFNLEHYNYILLDKGSDKKDLEEKLEQLSNDQLKPILEGSGISAELQAQSLNGLYFEPGLIDDLAKGNLTYVNAIAATGLIVLLIAGLNFINLSLTQSTKRLKEISIKRILGITRKQLVLQNVAEALLMSLLVLLTSGILIYLLDGLYFQYTGFHAMNLADNWLLICIICLVLFVLGIIGTSYTGIEFSFSSTFKSVVPVNTFKKVLLAFQFALASIVLIATLTMYKQISFMKNKELGFSKEQVLIVNLPDSETLKSKYQQFREQVKTFASVENTSLIGGGALPGEENGKEVFEISIDGNKQEKVYNFYRVDENYFDLLNIDFALGRDFQVERQGDKTNSVIINETLAKALNWENPIGKTIWYADQPRSVIGVVKNFHNKSLHNIIEPIVFMYDMHYSTKLLVKTSPAEAETIAALWKTNFPDTPFITSYFDGFLDAKYAKEEHLATLLGIFSMVSLILCCMGLFAIFSLNIFYKTKEISIRKILGASAVSLIKTTTKSYFELTIVSIAIAVPVSWLLMSHWLNEFAYRVQIDPLIFVFSTSLILFGSGITILYHVIQAINVNPAQTLKCE